MSPHPCQLCGACCAYYRVSFYWREAEEAVDGRHAPVPLELTEDRDSIHRSMKGTSNKHHVRCVALEGRVGESVGCSIYTVRPSPCRDFAASFEEGVHQPRCDEARAKHGLRALTRKDWPERDCGRGFPPQGVPVTILADETFPTS